MKWWSPQQDWLAFEADHTWMLDFSIALDPHVLMAMMPSRRYCDALPKKAEAGEAEVRRIALVDFSLQLV
jgi:hypothetical protein